MTMKDNCFNVFNQSNRLIIQSNLSKNRTFRVGMNALKHHSATENKTEWIWHHRYGHLNYKNLTQNVVSGYHK